MDLIIIYCDCFIFFFFSSRRRHTRFDCDWSSDVCSSDLDRDRAEGHDHRVLEVGREGRVEQQVGVVVERRRHVDEPWVAGQARDLLVGLERGDQHVIRREQEEDDEQEQEEMEGQERQAAMAHAAAARERARRAGGNLCSHQSRAARWRTSRRIMKAKIARIGNMNSDTAAPSGMSPLRMPRSNAQVPNRCVVLRGPPPVSTRTMSKLAKVTMVENSSVIATMLRIIGRGT